MPLVSSFASVHPSAEIGKDVEIGPYTIVGENVRIGDGTKIASHVVLDGWTRLGRNIRIGVGAVIGSVPQDLKFRGEESYVKIGDNTTIREYATINRGTFAGEETRVGNNCFVMSYCHIAHNCVLEDWVIMSSFAGLAGHIRVEQHAIIGGLVGIHQFVQIGRNAIVGGGSAVRQDILPCTAAGGNPCKSRGMNIVGLRRHNYSPERISQLKHAYKIIMRSKLPENVAVDRLNEEMGDVAEVQHMVEFIQNSQRGLARI